MNIQKWLTIIKNRLRHRLSSLSSEDGPKSLKDQESFLRGLKSYFLKV